MSARSRNDLTAWLGLVAMWLVVLAPIISQLVVSAHRHDPDNTPICSVAMPMPGDMPPSGMHDQGDMLAACGYCDLLADHIAIPSMPPVLPPFVMVVMFVAAAVLSTRFTPLGAFPFGRPRAPPVFS
ncbi:DUF2946 domain-containing protein [Burkholderia multivorans]|uniref:DUF2946 domain-containing protein n=1 Tax=Burkholderia multivorans TaxID=87883 RepID=A0AB37ARA2_9BURK|nr:DUF2946 domain-containing protein [Burkholderia multivorans]PRE45492.1 DUF2946 domain-containing protein [Burkholderia multivorans]PRE52228.1 DUF2946 domain-containing protein [Burkholderia multivorans]